MTTLNDIVDDEFGDIITPIKNAMKAAAERYAAEQVAASQDECQVRIDALTVEAQSLREDKIRLQQQVADSLAANAILQTRLDECLNGDPEPAVCPPGTDREGQVIPEGETEAWCTIPDPEPSDDLGLAIGGTWALIQTNSANDNHKATFENCFDEAPSLIGAGIRVPLDQIIDSTGNLITASTGLLARHVRYIREINAARGKDYKLSFRPIAGQHMPPAWSANMPAALKYTQDGMPGIHPCYNAVVTHTHDGKPSHTHQIGEPNDMYEARWRTFLTQLFAWREANAKDVIPFVHGCYYSLEWSEYFFGPANQPSQANYEPVHHRQAHKNLATIMHELQPADVATEWATTGRGPMVGSPSGPGMNPFIEEFTDHLASLYGSGSDRVYISWNGWSATKIAGAPDATTEYNKQWAARNRSNRRGNLRCELQDIAAGSTFSWADAYKWAVGGPNDVLGSSTSQVPAPRRTLGKAFDNGPDRYLENGVFPIEIYTYRFTSANGPAIEAGAAAHRRHVLALFAG